MTTRKNVADRANVSISIVSRVMNNSGYVADAKREAVLQAARELNYRPNPVARSLKQGKTKQILFYRCNLSGLYFQEMYQGVIDYAQDFGYTVFSARNLPAGRFSTMMMDGIILPEESFLESESGVTFYERFRALGIPLLVAGYGKKLPGDVYSVGVSTRNGMKRIIELLREKGHRRICFAGLAYERDEPRLAMFRAMMRSVYGPDLEKYVIGADSSKILGGLNGHYRIGEEAAERFKQLNLDATAVACFNDDVALGFCYRAAELGYRIPEDISVTGFDGNILGRYSRPPLTTVSLRAYEHGRQCAKVMLEMLLGDKKPPLRTTVPVELIERGSAAPPRR